MKRLVNSFVDTFIWLLPMVLIFIPLTAEAQTKRSRVRTFEEMYRAVVDENGQVRNRYRRPMKDPNRQRGPKQEAEPVGLPKPLESVGQYVTRYDPKTGGSITKFEYTLTIEETRARLRQLEAAAPGPRSSYEERYYYWIDKYKKYPECFM
jgi:hypothetical protein